MGISRQSTSATTRKLRLGRPDASEGAEEDEIREIQSDFRKNNVSTSRYNWYSFLPFFLFESFQKFANFYYLIVVCFQSIPIISITDGIPLSLFPLTIVLLFEGVITGLEDKQRHKDDAFANSSKAVVVEEGKLTTKSWKDVRVGDVLKLRNREAVPADCIVLAASDDPPQGVCFVETKSLDGETNLKLRQGLRETAEAVDRVAKSYMAGNSSMSKERAMDLAVSQLRGQLECELPNAHMDTFVGTASFYMMDGVDQVDKNNPASMSEGGVKVRVPTNATPLALKNILLRGCVIRSTDFVYGLVVYAGHDTKILKSMVRTKAKLSELDRSINRMLFGFVVLIILICVVSAWFSVEWVNAKSWDNKYVPENVTISYFLIRACTFFLLVCTMIPISLYVSLKLIRVLQSLFIFWDLEMINAGEDPVSGEMFEHKAKARTMDLCDTLGQVSYIFSDKTGTLTNNVMEFRKMSIDGTSYGIGTTVIGIAALEREGKAKEAKTAKVSLEASEASPHPRFINFAVDHPIDFAQIHKGKEFFLALALCHEVLIENIRDDEGRDTGKSRLSASSPDDQALVVAAGEFGFRFAGRGNGGRTILVEQSPPTLYIRNRAQYEALSIEERAAVSSPAKGGVMREFDLLETLEFSSTRKRASVIVREKNNGTIRLISKGADSEIFKRLDPNRPSTSAHITNEHLITFADDGLRTLTVAHKQVSDKEFEEWFRRYSAAVANVVEQEKRKEKEPNEIDDLMDEIESNLDLLGATAIEDKLQESVPDTIKCLREAGIKIWVLTGDKQETAINIAWACQLIDHSMKRVILTGATLKSKTDLLAALRAVHHEKDENYALIVDGVALKLVLRDADSPTEWDADCEKEFVSVASQCGAVVCCRVSPKQKADVVKCCRKYMGYEITLAIGDGANDVGMIQSAHVGVGVSGLEGMQAVNSADFAIGRFKFLKRLLLLHGRTNYRRAAKMVMLILYKNIFMIVAQLLWSSENGYSGQKFYFQLGVEGFNLIFTNSVLVVAIFDKDIPDRYLLSVPALYELGQKHQLMNFYVFWSYVLNAWFHAVVAYYFLRYGYQQPFMMDIWTMGTCLFTLVVVASNVKVAMEVGSWNRIMIIGFAIVLISWPLFALLMESGLFLWTRLGWEFHHVYSDVFSSSQSWSYWVVTFVALLSRDFAWKMAKRNWFPDKRHIYMEIARMSKQPFNDTTPVNSEENEIVVFSGTSPTNLQKKQQRGDVPLV